MSSKPVNQWHYQEVWDLMHQSMELVLKTKSLIEGQVKPKIEVNQMAYENLVDASAALYGCTQIIGSMATEEDNAN